MFVSVCSLVVLLVLLLIIFISLDNRVKSSRHRLRVSLRCHDVMPY